MDLENVKKRATDIILEKCVRYYFDDSISF